MRCQGPILPSEAIPPALQMQLLMFPSFTASLQPAHRARVSFLTGIGRFYTPGSVLRQPVDQGDENYPRTCLCYLIPFFGTALMS